MKKKLFIIFLIFNILIIMVLNSPFLKRVWILNCLLFKNNIYINKGS